MTTTRPAVLLVESAQGDTIGIRFPSRNTARDWEDRHPLVSVVGCVDLVTQRDAILDHGVAV